MVEKSLTPAWQSTGNWAHFHAGVSKVGCITACFDPAASSDVWSEFKNMLP